jgi:HK97 family phage prohead protease
VDKGAFKKSIKESKGLWPILADHNPTAQIGWNLRAEEDDKGLFVEGKLDLNVQSAREKYSLAKTAMESGAKMGLSIGYMVIKAEPDREKTIVRRLKELKMYEYSIVTFPMNTAAMITQMKSATSPETQNWLKNHLKQLKQQGITDAEIMMALQEEAAVDNESNNIHSLQKLIEALKA